MGMTRKIDGRTFRENSQWQRKRDAQKRARELRKTFRSTAVRVVPGGRGWIILTGPRKRTRPRLKRR